MYGAFIKANYQFLGDVDDGGVSEGGIDEEREGGIIRGAETQAISHHPSSHRWVHDERRVRE